VFVTVPPGGYRYKFSCSCGRESGTRQGEIFEYWQEKLCILTSNQSNADLAIEGLKNREQWCFCEFLKDTSTSNFIVVWTVDKIIFQINLNGDRSWQSNPEGAITVSVLCSSVLRGRHTSGTPKRCTEDEISFEVHKKTKNKILKINWAAFLREILISIIKRKKILCFSYITSHVSVILRLSVIFTPLIYGFFYRVLILSLFCHLVLLRWITSSKFNCFFSSRAYFTEELLWLHKTALSASADTSHGTLTITQWHSLTGSHMGVIQSEKKFGHIFSLVFCLVERQSKVLSSLCPETFCSRDIRRLRT
jgi:hypothetical protein